jgi:hypothetical protein
MDTPTLLARLQHERDMFEALLNQVGFTRRMTMNSLEGGLSVKDLLADILCREQFIADRLNEISHGEKYAPSASHSTQEEFRENYGFPDYESPLCEKIKTDHLVVHRHKNIALDEIVSQEIAAYESILSGLAKLTYSQCLDHDVYHRIAEHTYRPYRRTAAEIRRWLKSIAPESK